MLKPINKEASKAKVMNEKDVEKIEKEFLEKQIKDFSKYELSQCIYRDSYDEYKLTYINNLGEVTAFLAINQNEFEKYESIDINIDKVNNLIDKEIKNNYSNKLKDFKIENQFLTIEDDKLLLITNIGINLENSNINLSDSNDNYEDYVSYSYELN